MQTRRQFLLTGIAGTFFTVFPALAQPSKTVIAEIADKLSILLTHKASALVIGNSYRLSSNPLSTDMASEIEALLATLNLSPEAFLSLKNQPLLLHIHNAIEQDFKQENTRYVNGWLLSNTETQLCQVLALISAA
jgi:hypothetical protein